MNKGSHISLALFLLGSIDIEEFYVHKRSFLMGSILPDCLPSFLTTRHTVTETFEILKSELCKISRELEREKEITAYFCRHLGIVMHYIADYFTFPHNPGYTGTVRDHIEYEKELYIACQLYLEHEKDSFPMHGRLPKVDDVCDYILEKHTIYLIESHDKTIDCSYIAEVCQTVTCTIMSQLMTIPSAKQGGQIQAA